MRINDPAATSFVAVTTCTLTLVSVTAATMAIWTAATTVAPPDVAADVLSGIVGLAATAFLFYAMTWHARQHSPDYGTDTDQFGTGW